MQACAAGQRVDFRKGHDGLAAMAHAKLNTIGRAVASRSRTRRGVVTAPIFLLVPREKLPRRLDLVRDAERATNGVPGLIVTDWVEGRV